jgi:hypothetical protein
VGIILRKGGREGGREGGCRRISRGHHFEKGREGGREGGKGKRQNKRIKGRLAPLQARYGVR